MGISICYDKIVIVTRKTMLEELIERHGTHDQARFLTVNRGQSFQEIDDAHDRYHTALAAIKGAIPAKVRWQVIERSFLPNFLFSPHDLILTIGQDGLVVNAAKYLNGQPILAFNPDPGRIDGILVPFVVENPVSVLSDALYKLLPERH